MKITSLTLHPVVTDRRYGTVIARAGGRAKDVVQRSWFYLLELQTDDDSTGWGEISDIPQDELPADRREYEELLRAFTLGRDPFDVQRLHHEFREHFETSQGALPRYTACALDMACYDLQGQAARRPVYDLLGGALRRDVEISWVAYIREETDLLREEIREKVAEGFRAFKLKVGVDIELDEQRVALTRETAGKEANIKVDANEGWTVEEAPACIRRLNRYGLAGVETPVPRSDPRDVAAVRRQSDVPILEHVSDREYGLALLKADAVDVFNVATTGAGGLWPVRQLVALAEAGGVGVLIGSTVEMGPGTLAQLHLAATVRNLTLPSDLIGPGMYVEDVLNPPLTNHQGRLSVPDAPGLGIRIDRDKLRRLAF